MKVRTPNCVADMRDMETLEPGNLRAHYNNITTTAQRHGEWQR